MKNLKIFITAILMLLLILPISVHAVGSIKPSTSNLTITKGSTKTFQVTASNACGRVDISSSNSSVAKVNVSSQWLENNSVTVKVTGVSAGTAKITVRLTDAATFDEEVLSGTYTINVTVSNPQSGGSSNNNSSSNSSTTNKNLSTNNKIQGLSVEGYNLTNIGNDTYNLTVNNNVTNINIVGKAEDSKATISGIGKKDLKIGENKFTVTVKAESGAQKNYIINVTRKDGLYLKDLNTLLNDGYINNNAIIIKKGDSISKEIFNAIKQSKQSVTFNYYNDNDQLEFSWVIDGTLMQETTDFIVQDNGGVENEQEINIYMIIAIVELVVIAGLIIYCIKVNKKSKII